MAHGDVTLCANADAGAGFNTGVRPLRERNMSHVAEAVLFWHYRDVLELQLLEVGHNRVARLVVSYCFRCFGSSHSLLLPSALASARAARTGAL